MASGARRPRVFCDSASDGMAYCKKAARLRSLWSVPHVNCTVNCAKAGKADAIRALVNAKTSKRPPQGTKISNPEGEGLLLKGCRISLQGPVRGLYFHKVL